MAQPDNPFVGPQPFGEANVIYGRDMEISELRYFLGAKRIVLLYSPSGAGKSSLVQAKNGLIAKLKESKRFEIWGPARVNQTPDIAVGNPFAWSVINGFEKARPGGARPSASFANVTLEQYVKERKPARSPLLIFDQFEEVLRINPSDTGTKEAFFHQLGELLFNPAVWALFVIREDFLAGLTPYARQLPTHLQARYRLDFLRREDQALDAVRKPLESQGRTLAEGAAEQVLADLATVQTPQGAQVGQYVEPLQLQVVCRNLWENIAQRQAAVPVEAKDFGEITGALAMYYRTQVSRPDNIALERQIRDWFEESLITREGARNLVRQEAEVTAGLPNREVSKLADSYLVRPEQRAGGVWYELAHDRLVAPVRSNNAEWRTQNLSTLQRSADLWKDNNKKECFLVVGEVLASARKEAAQLGMLTPVETEFLSQSEALQELRDRELRRSRRDRIVSLAMTLIALVAVAASVFAYRKTHEAELNRAKAENALREAKVQSTRADRAGTAADAAKMAEAAAKAAERQQRANALVTQARADVTAAVNWLPLFTDRALAHIARALRSDPESVQAREQFVAICLMRGWWFPKAVAPAQGKILGLSLSDKGRVAVTFANNTVRVWDTDTGNPVGPSLPVAGNGVTAQISPDGKHLVVAEGNATVIRDVQSGKVVHSLASVQPVGQVMFDPAGRYVAAAAGMFVHVWNAATGAPMKGGWSGLAPARQLEFGQSRSRLMILENRLAVTDVEGGDEILVRPMRGKVMAAFSPTGNYAVKAAERSGVDFFDFQHTGTQPRLVDTAGTVTAVTLGSTEFGEVLAVGSDEGNLTIGELASGKHPAEMQLRNRNVAIGEIQSLAIRRNGLLALTAGNAAYVWNARSMHPVSQPLDRLSNPRLLQFQSDGNSIVMASASGIWRYRPVPPIRVTASLLPNAEVHADLAEAVGGYTLDEAGKPQVIPDEKRRSMFQALRQRAASVNDPTLQTAIETFAKAFLP